MKRKHLIIFGILFLYYLPSLSQTTISGRIFVSGDNRTLPDVNVLLYNAVNEEIVAGTRSDEKGRFILTVNAPGKYILEISFYGFERKIYKILAGTLNKTLDMGNIRIMISRPASETTIINGQIQPSPEITDRKNFHFMSFVTNATGTLSDIMKTLPGVSTDRKNNILLRGSEKFAVLINDKLSSITGFYNRNELGNISTSLIESVEIYNNPSTIYRNAGISGIVNINLKRNKENSFSGDIGFLQGFGRVSIRKADLPTGIHRNFCNPKFTPSFTLNYLTDKVNLFGQSSWIHQKSLPINEFNTRHDDDGNVTENQVPVHRSLDRFKLKFGIDWKPVSNQTFSIFGIHEFEGHIDSAQVWYFKNTNYANPSRKWAFRESEGTGVSQVTLQYNYKFPQSGHELTSRLYFNRNWEDVTYKLHQDGPAPYNTINSDKIHLMAPEYVWSFSSDYYHPLSFGRIEAGIRRQLRHMPIIYSESKNPENTALMYDFGNWEHWDENLVGSYLNFISEFEKVDIEAELKGEYTDVKYVLTPNPYFNDNRYNYLSLLPDLRITFKVNPSNRISLFCDRQIERPGEYILRMFPQYDDPEFLKIGNPSLRPQYTDYFELKHKLTWRTGLFHILVYHKIIKAGFSQVYIQDPLHDEVTIKAYDNLGKTTNSGFEIAFDQKLTRIWNLSATINIYRNIITAHSGQISVPVAQSYTFPTRVGTPKNVKLTNLITLSDNSRIEITAYYLSTRNIPQGIELPRGGLNLEVFEKLAGNKLELTFSATDITDNMGIRQKIEGSGFRINYLNYYESQTFSLGLKYRF